MNRVKLMIAAIFLGAFVLVSIEARPKYMRRYNASPNAKAAYKNKCTLCHIGKGGGENTYFGEDFASEAYQFTPGLREKYKKFFK